MIQVLKTCTSSLLFFKIVGTVYFNFNFVDSGSFRAVIGEDDDDDDDVDNDDDDDIGDDDDDDDVKEEEETGDCAELVDRSFWTKFVCEFEKFETAEREGDFCVSNDPVLVACLVAVPSILTLVTVGVKCRMVIFANGSFRARSS